MRSAAILAILAGCYSPSYQDCEVLCSDNACPSGLTCESGVCRTSGASGSCNDVIGDSGTGDRDGDRVVDSSDNCPDKSNAEQYDEDGDGTGDACDPCPIASSLLIANADLDGDNDGLGELCDPNPNSNADRLLLFEPFNVAPSGTTPVGSGSWAFANGQALAQVGTSEFGSLLFNVTPDSTRPYFVLTKVTLTGGATGSVGQDIVSGAGVAVAESPDGATGAGCSIGFAAGAPGLYAVSMSPNGDQRIGYVAQSYSQGIAYEVGGSRPSSSVIACNGSNNALIPMAPVPATAGVGSIGIHAASYSAAFDYLFVVDTIAP